MGNIHRSLTTHNLPLSGLLNIIQGKLYLGVNVEPTDNLVIALDLEELAPEEILTLMKIMGTILTLPDFKVILVDTTEVAIDLLVADYLPNATFTTLSQLLFKRIQERLLKVDR